MKDALKNRMSLVSGLLIILIGVFAVNFIASEYFTRWDLTSDNRYSLTKSSKKMAEDLEDVIFIRVYLDGDLPAGFKRLQNEIKEVLDELRAYSNGNLEYEFINPSADTDKESRNIFYQSLVDRGLNPTSLQVETEDGSNNKVVWPGAILSFNEKELPVQLLMTQLGADPEVAINNSIQQLEYNLSSTIRKLTGSIESRIAFVEGHGEWEEIQVADITRSLRELYRVDRVMINGDLEILDPYSAIIIAGPDSTFDKSDQFIIDQYIMNGGKVLWLFDKIDISMDSLRNANVTFGLARDLGIEEQLFKYGVRINQDLIQDLKCLQIPIVDGSYGDDYRQSFKPWFYFPILFPENSNHPIVNNIDGVKTHFISSIDTVAAKGVTKTILLASSQTSKLKNAPVRVSVNEMRMEPDIRQFKDAYKPAAVLLEGEFESVFKNRVVPKNDMGQKIGVKERSVPTAQIVVSDADIITNRVDRDKRVYPLEYDVFTQRSYGNKDFLLNCINYLCDDSGIISSRAKVFKLRLLNRDKIKNDKSKWQFVNVGIPAILIICFGFLQFYIRKRKYTK
jgi:ABC-2 type transport system permease protein